jgi:hypothetical protein
VLGFLACAAVLRREAFRQVGGFNPALHMYGEEDLLAMDLAAAGWRLSYVMLPWALRHRQPLPPEVEPASALIDAGAHRDQAFTSRYPSPA